MTSAKYSIFIILLISIFYIFINKAEALELNVIDKKDSGRAVGGEMIIEVKKGIIDLGREKGVVSQEKVKIDSESLAALNKKYGLISIERLFSGSREGQPSDIYLFRFPPKVDIKELVSRYKEDASVIYCEPNYTVHIE